MAYIPELQRVVLFGGLFVAPDNALTPLNTTWLFDGSDWILDSPDTTPPVIWDGMSVYVPARQGMLVTGGNSPNQNDVINQVWVYAPED